MLRALVTIFLFFISPNLFGQKCETIGGKIMNCKDKDSLKQGLWYDYTITKIITTDSFNRGGHGIHNDEGIIYNPIGEGMYKDGKRVGTWIFYEGFYNDSYAHEKTVIFTDSGYRREIDSVYHYHFRVSDDSSKLTGTIHLKSDTIFVSCKSGKCKLFNEGGKRIYKFQSRDLIDRIRTLNIRYYRSAYWWGKSA